MNISSEPDLTAPITKGDVKVPSIQTADILQHSIANWRFSLWFELIILP